MELLKTNVLKQLKFPPVAKGNKERGHQINLEDNGLIVIPLQTITLQILPTQQIPQIPQQMELYLVLKKLLKLKQEMLLKNPLQVMRNSIVFRTY
jgi:hypothetical protein